MCRACLCHASVLRTARAAGSEFGWPESPDRAEIKPELGAMIDAMRAPRCRAQCDRSGPNVPDGLHDPGVGGIVLGVGEARALEHGGHSAAASTFSFPAQGFDLRLGYEVFADFDHPADQGCRLPAQAASGYLPAAMIIDMHTHAGRPNRIGPVDRSVLATMGPGGVAAAVVSAIADLPMIRRDRTTRRLEKVRDPEPGRMPGRGGRVSGHLRGHRRCGSRASPRTSAMGTRPWCSPSRAATSWRATSTGWTHSRRAACARSSSRITWSTRPATSRPPRRCTAA